MFQQISKEIPWLQQRQQSFFLYDLAQIDANLISAKNLWQKMTSKPFQVFYSVKANPNSAVVQHLDSLGVYFDISARAELDLCLKLGVPAENISVSGPAKTDLFLETIAKTKLQGVHLDSVEEYQVYSSMNSSQTPFTLRMNVSEPPWQKLGLSEYDLTQILSKESSQRIKGLHAYMGREEFTVAKATAIVKKFHELHNQFPKSFYQDFQIFLGAGMPVLEKTKMDAGWGEIAPISETIHLEIGRALVSTAGVYACQILSVKHWEKTRRSVIIHGGHQHLAGMLVSPIFGPDEGKVVLYRDQKPVTGKMEPATIYGSLCLPRDMVHPNMNLPQDCRRGDWLMFSPCGAYGLTAGTNSFIGSEKAKEFVLSNGVLVDVSTKASTYHEGLL